MKTGDCRDPMTRENYTDNDLIRLDLEAKNLNLKYRSTYKIKKNLNYARRIRNTENEILSFQMRIDELKEIIFFIITSEMYLWNIGNEPILIENISYISVTSYITCIVHELKMVLVNLRVHDNHSVDTFKTYFINSIKEFNLPPNIFEIISNI
jgi:hypothetical protein